MCVCVLSHAYCTGTSPHKFSGVKPGRYVVQVECTFADMEIQVLEIDPFTVTEPPLLVTELAGIQVHPQVHCTVLIVILPCGLQVLFRRIS